MEKGKAKYPGRPPRLGRVFAQSPLYFITFNTYERKRILANETVHAAFKDYAEKNLCRGFAMGRYVIMPDHIHFFVRVGMDGKLDQYIRLMKQSITKALRCSGGSANRSCSGGSMNRSMPDEIVQEEAFLRNAARKDAVHRTAATKTEQGAAHRATATTPKKAVHRTAATSFWQPGFFDHVMRNHESYTEKWNYVRMNPVRAGLVDDSDAWAFQGAIEHIFFD